MTDLYSTLGVVAGGIDLYGKRAFELGSFQMTDNGYVYGKANYVAGYTGFNATEPNEQEGYYLPLAFHPAGSIKEAFMQVEASKKKAVKMDAENVLFLGSDAAAAKKKQVIVTAGKKTAKIKLSDVTFAKK